MNAVSRPGRNRGRIQWALCGIALWLVPSLAWPQLMLYPTRVVFEGNQRATQVELINHSSASATYRITLVNRRMDEFGGMSDVVEPLPEEQPAEELVRFSPRQVTLLPGAGQTVRIMVRKHAGLPAGEYRSHLLFSQQPETRGASSAASRGGEDRIAVKLEMLVGTSIPVIVRHGETQSHLNITDLKLLETPGQAPALQLVMERGGNESVYGDLTVSLVTNAGREHVVGRANGVAVYTPNTVRRAKLSLALAGQPITGGDLRVTFRERAEAGGGLLAEAYLPLP